MKESTDKGGRAQITPSGGSNGLENIITIIFHFYTLWHIKIKLKFREPLCPSLSLSSMFQLLAVALSLSLSFHLAVNIAAMRQIMLSGRFSNLWQHGLLPELYTRDFPLDCPLGFRYKLEIIMLLGTLYHQLGYSKKNLGKIK